MTASNDTPDELAVTADPGIESAPATLTDAQRRSVLRRCLASALRAGGYDQLTAGEVGTTQPRSDRLTTTFVFVLFWGVCLAVADRIDGPWWSWPLAGLAVVIVFAVIANVSGAVAATGLLLMWLLLGWIQVNTDGLWLITHAIPAGGLLLFSVVTHQIDVRSVRDVAVAVAAIPRAAPLVAPLVLVVLVLPSLSEDVWKVADALDATRLVELVVITVGLLFFLVVRQLRAELPQVLVARATALVADPSRVEQTRDALRSRLRDETFELASTESDTFIAEAWPSDGAQYAGYIAASAHGKITSPLLARLALCVVFIAAAVSLYLYALVNVIVDTTVVTSWTGGRVSVSHLDVLGLAIDLPGEPYLAITGLLACFAVGTFLAFVLIEERFSVALGDALLRLPTDRLLALALPFLHLTEERIVDGDPLPEDFDVGALGSAGS